MNRHHHHDPDGKTMTALVEHNCRGCRRPSNVGDTLVSIDDDWRCLDCAEAAGITPRPREQP